MMINNRTVFVYFMAVTYLCTHFFVTLTSLDFQTNSKLHGGKNVLNFRSKRLLNFNNEENLLNKLKRSSRIRLDILPNQSIQIDRPSPNKKYNLKSSSNFYSQILQDTILVALLNSSYLNSINASHNGLFVEAGAYDGETHSNTLYLEKNLNWTGLLIEPSAENYKNLLAVNRRSYSVNSCLSSTNQTDISSFIEAGPFGTTVQKSSASTYQVKCFPLANILETFLDLIGKENKVVDYMSIDIEGNERSVIEHFDWNRFTFKLLNIEYNQDKELYMWIVDFMGKIGYKETVFDDVWYQDVYLAHQSIYDKLNLNKTKVSNYKNLN